MTVEQVSDLVRMSILTTLWVAAPILLGATGLGLLISILQAATQVNEQTLTFVPKIVFVLLLFAGLFPWMMGNLMALSMDVFQRIVVVGGGG